MAIPTEADVAQKMAEPLVRQHAPEIQAAGYGALLTRIPTIDDLLNEHATALRDDFPGYRNHVYRIVNLCAAAVGRSEHGVQNLWQRYPDISRSKEPKRI